MTQSLTSSVESRLTHQVIWAQASGAFVRLCGRIGGSTERGESLAGGLSLGSLLWAHFDAQAELPTDTLEFLEAQMLAVPFGVKSGFILVRRAGAPVAMTPFFVCSASFDDGPATTRMRSFCRFLGLKQVTRWLGVPASPIGMKGVFFGAPYNYVNRIYTASGTGAELEDGAVLKRLAAVAAALRRRHLAPMWCLHRFAASPVTTRLLSHWGMASGQSWPDTWIDFAALRREHDERRQTLQLQLRALSEPGAPKKGDKRQLVDELNRLGSRGLSLESYPERIESSNDRHNFRKNGRRFAALPGFYIEQVSGERARALLPQLMRAARTLYERSLTQWLPVSAALYWRLFGMSMVHTRVLWFQPEKGVPVFAGFLVELRRGREHVNFRMGISPEFARADGSKHEGAQNLVWHRLMHHEIGEALVDGADHLYCGPTCYNAKKRIGYSALPISSGFSLALVGSKRLEPQLSLFDGLMLEQLEKY